MNQNENQDMPPGLRLRVVVSMIVSVGLMTLANIAVYFTSFSNFQKIAVMIVIFLATMRIVGLIWASWGFKNFSKLDDGNEWKKKGWK